MIHLIAFDPGVNESAMVICTGDLPDLILRDICMVKTADLVKRPSAVITLTNSTKRVLVIEKPYMGERTYYHKKERRIKTATLAEDSINLALAVGQISGAVSIALGFEVVEAPTFGPESWIAKMLNIGGKMPDTRMVKLLSIALAKKLTNLNLNEHKAAAVCIAQWWIDKQKMSLLTKGALI